MSGNIHQETKVGLGSNTQITNTYPRKRGRLTNLPLNSNVKFGRGFSKTTLQSKIARLKSSTAYRKGQQEASSQIKRIKSQTLSKGKTISLRKNNLNVRITAS